MEKKWCMCLEIGRVARDMYSTCLACGGKDAYGGSDLRTEKFKKKITTPKKKTNKKGTL